MNLGAHEKIFNTTALSFLAGGATIPTSRMWRVEWISVDNWKTATFVRNPRLTSFYYFGTDNTGFASGREMETPYSDNISPNGRDLVDDSLAFCY